MAELDDRKKELSAQLDRARSRIGANRRELGEDLNAPAKLKASLSKHRFVWLGAAVLLGLLIAKLPARTKKVVVDRKGRRQADVEKVEKASLLVAFLKIVFDLAKPFIIKYGKEYVLNVIEQRTSGRGGPRRGRV